MTNQELLKTAIAKGLKVVFFDVETSPVLVWTYPMFDVNIPSENIEQDMKVTSVAWQFEGDRKPSFLEWGVKRNDRKMLARVTKILNSADLVVGQNSDSFDIKTIQWRLNVLDLPPIKKLMTLDTLKLSRKAYRPTSHKLDYRSRTYNLGGKIPQSMQDCIAVAKGNRATQKRRIEYNIKDVTDLKEIFWRELRTYHLPVTVVRFLEKFINQRQEVKEFCKHCKKYKHQAYDLTIKGEVRQCNNCRRLWKVKK